MPALQYKECTRYQHWGIGSSFHETELIHHCWNLVPHVNSANMKGTFSWLTAFIPVGYLGATRWWWRKSWANLKFTVPHIWLSWDLEICWLYFCITKILVLLPYIQHSRRHLHYLHHLWIIIFCPSIITHHILAQAQLQKCVLLCDYIV